MRYILALVFLFATSTLFAACQPGTGHDYQVGPGAGQLSSLAQIPWNTLQPGDTIRIFYSPNAYKTKFAINSNDVVVCGVKGPGGEYPVIDGSGAMTSPNTNYGRASAVATNKSRGLVWVGSRDVDADVRKPVNVRFANLKLVHVHPSYSYDGGNAYTDFGAAIWVDVGDNVTLDDIVIDDVTQGLFTRSLDGGDAKVSRNTLVQNVRITNWGVAGSNTIHAIYTESQGIVFDSVYIGPPRTGAGGNGIKDRSTGTVIRYSTLLGGSYAFDLVEAEDFPNTAKADPNYRKAFVYGNLIRTQQLGIHYGGDHAGSESNYRKGTLYVYNMTFDMQTAPGEGQVAILRVSTTDESAILFNNVFFAPLTYPVGCQPGRDCSVYLGVRASQDVAPPYVSGGIVTLGVNFDMPGCTPPGPVCDGDPYHAVGGQLNGTSNLIVDRTKPFDANLVPIAGSKIDNFAQAPIAEVAAYPVLKQPSLNGVVTARASVADLGAIESGGTAPPQECTNPQPTVTPSCPSGGNQTGGTWQRSAYPQCQWTYANGACPPPPPPIVRYAVTVRQGLVSRVYVVTDPTAVQFRLVARHWRVFTSDTDVFDFPSWNQLSVTQRQITATN